MKISKSLLPVLGTQAVKVIPSDKRLVKQLHDNLFLSCFGSDLEWVNPKGHAIATKQRSDSIYVESRSNQLRLWIKNLRMEDVGDYTCRSASKEDEKFEVRNVMVRPEVDFRTDEQQMFIEGVDAEIACDFSANGLDTIVEWYAPGNPNPLLPNSGNDLLVEDITREDGGIYRCTVITTDTGDVDDVDILVEIEYPPEIDDCYTVDSEVWLTEGQNFSVPCEANALPAPEITWSRETAEGENDVIGKENNLMFTDIRLENSGKYICSAKNDHGTISKSFNLVVLSPPTTLVNDQLVDGTDFPYFVNLGDPMKFVCENMFPADFVWTTPDGSQAAMDQLNRVAETTDSGFYTCTSTIKRGRTNEMIEVSSSVNVQVRYQPMIATEELEIYSYPGLQTNIPCSFMANPVGFTAISGPEIEEELLLNEVNYAFKAEEKDFPSTFQCTSRNDLGSEEYEVSLLKAEKPKELRLLKLVQRRPDRVVISYSRDYSKGQIDLSDVVVHLSSPHRADVIRTIPVDNQNHVTIEDLDPERTYILRLQGINAVGESPVSKKLEFTTDDLDSRAPVVQINRVSADKGQYYVEWEITNNGGGRMRELKLQYGMYKNGEMISIGDISDFPKSNSGKIKIPDLQKNENYWVVLAAKNEKFPSKTVSCDVTAKDSSQNRVLFLAIGSFVFLLIVGLAIDVTCYFTKQQGLLNRIVARKIPAGAKPIGANSSEEASSTDESEEKCLKSKLDEDSEDQGMGSLTESATRLETVKEVGEN